MSPRFIAPKEICGGISPEAQRHFKGEVSEPVFRNQKLVQSSTESVSPFKRASRVQPSIALTAAAQA
jgi:hypothetical protein